LILLKDSVLYYTGVLKETGQAKYTSYKGLRNVVAAHKKSNSSTAFNIVIKPTTEATYKNTVDALDEMTINIISQYALVDLAEGEKKLLHILDTPQSAHSTYN
jgi:hypothetical protein